MALNPPYSINLTNKDIKKLNSSEKSKQFAKLLRRIAFSRILHSKFCKNSGIWFCCDNSYKNNSLISKHISLSHKSIINDVVGNIETHYRNCLAKQQLNTASATKVISPNEYKVESFCCSCDAKKQIVLLYYQYVCIPNVEEVKLWQEKLCKALKVNGKIKVAKEGINGTLEGCHCSTECYMNEMMKVFNRMTKADFKMSDGDGKCFDDLEVTIKEEICSLGVSSSLTKEPGVHLNPDDFHKSVKNLDKNSVLLDCRNFYESKIGTFDNSITPNLRKFSYFPEYVDKNLELFKNKNVFMFCTGGIRCERASAYIKGKNISKEVYQLNGGIHKYLEKYPDGLYKGKLFVFDNRHGIKIGEPKNVKVISQCTYCSKPHDDYELCTTDGCRQLILSCKKCRNEGKTTCCVECSNDKNTKEQCTCTKTRYRIPKENCL